MRRLARLTDVHPNFVTPGHVERLITLTHVKMVGKMNVAASTSGGSVRVSPSSMCP